MSSTPVLVESPHTSPMDDGVLLELETPPNDNAVAKTTTTHTYRPDVDGLRTLAVVPVLVFHAYPTLLPGGFIGVDIFFVISGFLISGILFRECQLGKFTYAGFYARRIRRIFPTLLLVLVATFWLGFLYLMAPKLKAMAATMLAATLFGANLQVLTLKHSYFSLDVKSNPLLHLWSLGVEEQFYIFWPLLASLLMRLRFRVAVTLQVLFLVASFVVNITLLGFHGDNKMSFYMPLSRFWQMSAGGLLAYLGLHGRVLSGVWPTNLAAVLGLSFLVPGFVCINEASAFPGYLALLPTLGATLLLAAGADAVVNKYALGNVVAVYIGKISYCLYLWHWPLLVFAIERFPDEADRPFYMQPYAMLLLSLLLSVMTYEDLEGRLRRRKSKYVTPLLLVCMLAVAILAGCAYKNPSAFSEIERDLAKSSGADDVSRVNMAMADLDWSVGTSACAPDSVYISAATNPVPFPFTDPVRTDQLERCEVINPGHEADGTLVVLGDSHADMTVPRFMKLYDDAVAAKTPFPTIVLKDRWGRAMLPCRPEFAANLEMLKHVKPQAVLVVVHWVQFLNPGGPLDRPYADPPQCCLEEFTACAEQTMKDVQHIFDAFGAELAKVSALGIKVFVVDQSPEFPRMVPNTWLSGSSVKPPAPVSRAAFQKEMAWLLDPLHAAVAVANATLLDYAENYSTGDLLTLVDADGHPTMTAGNHLSTYTSRKYLSIVDQVVAAARSSP
ncbi:hypothetical protein SDRG_07482 [Saprolegnia diclina VS20]|uniref:Acyltransferase 3 domain-containing protein n=1 Tax=Saprolegnia diclina (strain VS20) TaxID=1156394 RepID=T0QBG6_SAPDV|nr:hypothetical protein SDRG_07482 [Saprolegnia diclina VS20]EQC35254.1 hypothetical protein SDRG_07482 [Saprolegnia diclina VS20]|eukprot:XP_008611538.1 hypothetical protein SDRG_07482 [Saprolegnia diclina VS20]